MLCCPTWTCLDGFASACGKKWLTPWGLALSSDQASGTALTSCSRMDISKTQCALAQVVFGPAECVHVSLRCSDWFPNCKAAWTARRFVKTLTWSGFCGLTRTLKTNKVRAKVTSNRSKHWKLFKAREVDFWRKIAKFHFDILSQWSVITSLSQSVTNIQNS